MNNKNSRTNALPGLTKKSPVPKNYDFTKTNTYEGKSDTIGGKIAKAFTPKNMLDLIPVSKGVKLAKGAYNLFKGDKA